MVLMRICKTCNPTLSFCGILCDDVIFNLFLFERNDTATNTIYRFIFFAKIYFNINYSIELKLSLFINIQILNLTYR